jgi:MFS family permease
LWRRWPPADDLLRQANYRRLLTSILLSSLGAQVTLLALPLTAALLLHATPVQMGLLTACEVLPFALFALPAGVWLDRVRKLPVVLAGELLLSAAVASVPLAWWLDALAMPWLYGVAFVIGVVNTTAGSASQIVLTQVVPRERLVEAHAKNALASSGAEVAGPGLAGVLVRAVGAPLALLLDAAVLLLSALILRGLQLREPLRPRVAGAFGSDLRTGLRHVREHALLRPLAWTVGGWQLCHHAVLGVLILFATRRLGMSEQAVGVSFACMGLGTVVGSLAGDRISRHCGPGPSLVLGVLVSGLCWLGLALSPLAGAGSLFFAAALAGLGFASVLLYVNFLALRQAATPAPLLGRMTSTMRWLVLLPAGPGALAGGWSGGRWGLEATLALAGGVALLLALLAWCRPAIRQARQLPEPEDVDDLLGTEAAVRPVEP